MSGSIGNYWAVSEEENHLSRAFQVANQLGKSQHSFQNLTTFLKTVPAASLNQLRFYEPNTDDLLSGTIFGPVIEST